MRAEIRNNEHDYVHGLVEEMNALFIKIKEYKAAHPRCKAGYYQRSPGSWLNAYREGDLTFEECIALIEQRGQAAQADLAVLLPDTWYADRDVTFRLERLVEQWRKLHEVEKERAAECERLRVENARLLADIESGFMSGAYARLSNLQQAERERDELRQQIAVQKNDGDEYAAWLQEECDLACNDCHKLARRIVRLRLARRRLNRQIAVKDEALRFARDAIEPQRAFFSVAVTCTPDEHGKAILANGARAAETVIAQINAALSPQNTKTKQ